MRVDVGLGVGPGEGETGIGGDYQHARDAWAMGKARGEGTISHMPRASHSEPCTLRGLTHQSLHTWSFCTQPLPFWGPV